MNIKVAFGSVPKDSGTFTFYRNLRPALLQRNIDLQCIAVGRNDAKLWDDSYADDGCVLLAENTKSLKKQSQIFVNWCEKESVDLVMAINSEAILSSIPHLSERIRVLSRCANAFDHGYRITLSGRERLAAIVATTPRLQDDLISKYKANPDLITLIPNGINPIPFNDAASVVRGTSKKLRIGFLGRLENNQKGIFHIPKVVRELNHRNIDFELKIAGKGRDRTILERQLHTEVGTGQVQFLGALSPTAVPEFLSRIDIFLFTSHFEGCPNALLEALMAGCVPTSWIIDGITNYVLRDSRSGFVSELGNYECLVNNIEALDKDRPKLQAISHFAAQDARERFSSASAADRYASLFQGLMENPAPPWRARDWSEFNGDVNFSHSWKDNIPSSLKIWLRSLKNKKMIISDFSNEDTPRSQ